LVLRYLSYVSPLCWPAARTRRECAAQMIGSLLYVITFVALLFWLGTPGAKL
jgi:hypothetical protein